MKIAPMLAKLGDKEDLYKESYIYEPKLDGTRAICYKNGVIKIVNRRDKNITHKYPEFHFAQKIKAKSCILDGEIIVYDKDGKPSFNLLQKRDQLANKLLIEMRSETYSATYVVFDILMKNGKSLTNFPLSERKKILQETIIPGNHIETIFYTKNGKDLWREVTKRKLEGVMAKYEQGSYYSGKRTGSWLKIKNIKSIDCVIVGYTKKIRVISSLVLGVYYEKKLRYIGKVGTGFTERFLQTLHGLLKPLETTKPTVKYTGKTKIIWVKPKLVCEVEYLEITKSGKLRAPSFIRLRDDKLPEECFWEDQV